MRSAETFVGPLLERRTNLRDASLVDRRQFLELLFEHGELLRSARDVNTRRGFLVRRALAVGDGIPHTLDGASRTDWTVV